MSENRDDIKPKNLSIHEFLLRKTAVKMMISESIVEKVITHEKKSINGAFKTKNEVEISGFGKFTISQVKLKKKIKKLGKTLSTLQQRNLNDPNNPDTIFKLQLTHKELDYFYSKLKPDENRPEGDSGGHQECSLPSQGDQATDRGNIGGEIINLQELS